jgi:ribonuclease HIII
MELNSVEISAKKIISSYINVLVSKNIHISEPIRREFCYEIIISDNSEKVKLQVYFGKKGNKTVLQGNVNSQLYSNLNSVIFGEKLFQQETNELIEPDTYIGTDESGKGDYFGPLIIAGVFVDNNANADLKKIGVKDSKLLSDPAINSLAKEIKKIVKNNFDIILISPEKYNILYEQFGNLNKLLAWGHAKVIENVLKNNNALEVISDKFGDERLIKGFLQEKGKMITLHQFTKAERYTAVAAASILARNKLNIWFEEQSKKIGINLPKGASSKVEETAIELKQKYDKNVLSSLVKLHFKTTKKLL